MDFKEQLAYWEQRLVEAETARDYALGQLAVVKQAIVEAVMVSYYSEG